MKSNIKTKHNIYRVYERPIMSSAKKLIPLSYQVQFVDRSGNVELEPANIQHIVIGLTTQEIINQLCKIWFRPKDIIQIKTKNMHNVLYVKIIYIDILYEHNPTCVKWIAIV